MTIKQQIEAKLADKTVSEQKELLIQFIANQMMDMEYSAEQVLNDLEAELPDVNVYLKEDANLDEEESEVDSE